MEQKNIQNKKTVENNSQIQCLQQLKFFKEEREPQKILQHLLKNYNEEEQDSRNKLARVKNILQDQLDQFDLTQKIHIQKYLVSDQLKHYLEHFCGSSIPNGHQNNSEKLLTFQPTYIDYLQSKVSELLTKISLWKQQRNKIVWQKEKQLKMNLLNFKSYNLKNYIEQLILINDLVKRVKRILKDQIPDIRHLQELVYKKVVPYNFYRKYCLQNCCKVIDIRTKAQKLTMLTQSSHHIDLLTYIKNYFFSNKTIDQKCTQLLSFCKYIRITNQFNISIDNGFIYSFKPFFIQSLEQCQAIDTVQYQKSRSIMQSNEQTIDILMEFEDIKIEKYCIWFYEQMQLIKKCQTVHLQRIKIIIQQYRGKYKWISQIGIKSNKIHSNLNFETIFIKSVIIKILKPFLLHLYFFNISQDKSKLLEKHKKELNRYWVYWLFHNYTKLFAFLSDKLIQLVDSFDKLHQVANFEEGELNPIQYYSYYQQVSEIIEDQKNNHPLAVEYINFWKNLIVKFSFSFPKDKTKISQSQHLKEDLQWESFLQNQQQKLKTSLKTKNKQNHDQFEQSAYISLTKLNFNTGNYFLLEDTLKLLSKDVNKEISLIREVAYKNFYQ